MDMAAIGALDVDEKFFAFRGGIGSAFSIRVSFCFQSCPTFRGMGYTSAFTYLHGFRGPVCIQKSLLSVSTEEIAT